MNRLLMLTILAAATKVPSVFPPTLKSKRWNFLPLLSPVRHSPWPTIVLPDMIV
jgi:hypothetical protein